MSVAAHRCQGAGCLKCRGLHGGAETPPGNTLTVRSVNRNDPDHVYMNLAVPPNRSATAAAYSKAEYSSTRTQPIIDRPCDYHMSVIRFDVPTDLIPICIITGYNGDAYSPSGFARDQTTSSVTIVTAAGVPHVQPVLWTPESTASAYPVPQATSSASNPITAQSTQYFWLYSYQHWIDCINTALAAANTAASTGLAAPVLTFSAGTSLVTLNAATGFLTNPGTNPAIFFNDELMEFFNGTFRAIFNGINNANGLDFQLVVENTGNNLYTGTATDPAPPIASPFYAMSQEFVALSLWTDFSSLLLTSNATSLRLEFAAENNISGALSSGTGSSINSQTPILTDFFPLIEGNATSQRQSIQYYPSGEYRLSDLKSDQPLQSFDCQVFWTDTFGIQYPLLMTHNYTVNVKILFRRKGAQAGK